MDPESHTQAMSELCEVCRRNVGTVACPVADDLPPVMICEQCEAALDEPVPTLVERLVAAIRRLFHTRRRK